MVVWWVYLLYLFFFCFYYSRAPRDLHVLTHSFPTRRSSVLLHPFVQPAAAAARSLGAAALAPAHRRYIRRVTGTSPPCRASARNMPSRMPRSATPKIGRAHV